MSSSTLEREQSILPDGTTVYKIGEEYVESSENNVSMHIRPGACDDGTYPACPDCGGTIVWDERTVPGRRRCRGCGSLFADMRYHAQAPGQHMPGRASVARRLAADPEAAAACERVSSKITQLQCTKCGSRYDSFLELACHVNGAHPEVFA